MANTIPNVITAQTGGREFNRPDITKYSLFVGGVNATHHALENYTPQLNGYGRLFMVRPPKAIQYMFTGGNNNYIAAPENLFNQFKHMLEYMNRSVTGFGEKTLGTASTPIQGGYAGRLFKTPTVTQETTNEITISLYEMAGSPVFTVVDGWMNAIGDENSGLATYGGYVAAGKDASGTNKALYSVGGNNVAYEYNEAYHTAECIYVVTDKTGAQVERAVLIADMFPKGIQQGNVLNMEQGGAHDNVTYDITFNAVVYRSPIITAIAADLLRQYLIVSNSLNFNPQLGDALYGDAGTTGKGYYNEYGVPTDSAVGTKLGNVPVFTASRDFTQKDASIVDVNTPAGEKYKKADGKFTS